MSNIILRGNTWHFLMRVPARFSSVEPRRQVTFTLRTSDRLIALERSDEARDRLLSLWEAQMSGQAKKDGPEYEKIVAHARSLGFVYRPLDKIDDETLVQRLIKFESEPEVTQLAALGLAGEPKVQTDQLFETFSDMTKDQRAKKTASQLRIWKNPYIRAQAIMVDAIGRKPITEMTREDGLSVRADLEGMVFDKVLKAGSANRMLGCLSSMFNTYNTRMQLDMRNPFSRLSFKEGDDEELRPPVPEEYVRMVFVAGALDGLNAECQAILKVVINTGVRPSELIGALPKHIRLQDNIPHLQVRAEKRELKTRETSRDVPLLGCALEEMRKHPEGFPRYRANPQSATTNINKFLKNNGLVPEYPDKPGRHLTTYCYRHSFQDRLTAAEIPDRIAKDLMGHKIKGERYGEGATLEHMARLLGPISY